MPKILTLEETYDSCTAKGMLVPISEINIDRIHSMLDVVMEDLLTVDELVKKKNRWSTAYKLNYDALHTLSEVVMMFDEIKSSNHQCLFSALCVKHPELELDWNFFEKIRIKRNGIHYYGARSDSEEWTSIAVQSRIYINTLRKTIEKNLNSHA